MKIIGALLAILTLFFNAVHAETVEDAKEFLKSHGGEDISIVTCLTAQFEGSVEAISIGRYNGAGTTTYNSPDQPKRIGDVKHGIITLNGNTYGVDGFATNTVYAPNGPAFTRYVGASKVGLIVISFSENIFEGYSIDFYSSGRLLKDRYNLRFPHTKADQEGAAGTSSHVSVPMGRWGSFISLEGMCAGSKSLDLAVERFFPPH
jgi:hypothetical protein